jgi:hypothetical protein
MILEGPLEVLVTERWGVEGEVEGRGDPRQIDNTYEPRPLLTWRIYAYASAKTVPMIKYHSSVAVLTGCRRTGNSLEYVVSQTVDGDDSDEARDVTTLNDPRANGRPHPGLVPAATSLLRGGKGGTRNVWP